MNSCCCVEYASVSLQFSLSLSPFLSRSHSQTPFLFLSFAVILSHFLTLSIFLSYSLTPFQSLYSLTPNWLYASNFLPSNVYSFAMNLSISLLRQDAHSYPVFFIAYRPQLVHFWFTCTVYRPTKKIRKEKKQTNVKIQHNLNYDKKNTNERNCSYCIL